jgi:glycosyltransferase involved in cell wall biosynthesis
MIYGAVNSLVTLAKEQKRYGHNISMITFKGRPFTHEIASLGFETRAVKVRTKIDPFAILEMRKQYKALGADIVHTHLSTSSVNGCIAAKLGKIPSVATVHGMSGKLSFIFADHLISVSNGVKNHLVSQGIKLNKITTVYNGVPLPLDHLTREVSRKQFGISLDSFVIGTVARLTPMKGIEHLINAFNLLQKDIPDTLLLLIGDGDHEMQYRKQVDDLKLNKKVIFGGYQSKVNDALVSMDIFAFPSLKEAMGIAVVEAMSMGLPIVSTNVGGLIEVVTKEVGMLVPPEDSVSMANALRELIDNRLILASMAETAKERSQNLFSVGAMLAGTNNVYEGLISNDAR